MNGGIAVMDQPSKTITTSTNSSGGSKEFEYISETTERRPSVPCVKPWWHMVQPCLCRVLHQLCYNKTPSDPVIKEVTNGKIILQGILYPSIYTLKSLSIFIATYPSLCQHHRRFPSLSIWKLGKSCTQQRGLVSSITVLRSKYLNIRLHDHK